MKKQRHDDQPDLPLPATVDLSTPSTQAHAGSPNQDTVEWKQVDTPLGDSLPVTYVETSVQQTQFLRQPGVLGGYDILGELGRGAMGVVYKAFQRGLDRIVALKMVLAGNHANPEQLRRFIIEAKAVAHLQHPNIVQVFDIGESEGLPYFSLEFVDGPSLARRLERLPQAPEASARMTEILARTMGYAHDNGVLHRDLKPGNILLTSTGVPKIADFGLAKQIDDADDGSSTRTGTIMGTPSYMAPEQALGDVRQVGPAVDQYSLGAILYEMLTGRPPFMAARAHETILQVIHDDPIPPRQLVPRIPKDLETICMHALQKDPSARYPDCRGLADDLASYLAGLPIQARPVSRFEKSWRWCRRNPVVASLASTAVLLLIAIATSSSWMASVLSAKNKDLIEATKAANENAEEASLQKEEAIRRSDRLKRMIQTTITDVNRINVTDNPTMRDYVKKTLDDMIPLLEEIVKELPLTDEAEPTLASGITEIAKAYREQGNSTAAETKYRELVEFGRRRMVIKGASDAARLNLSKFLLELAAVRLEANRDFDEHLKLLEESRDLAQDVIDHPRVAPDDGKGASPFMRTHAQLAEVQNRLATAQYRLGKPLAAKVLYDQAISQFKAILNAIPDGKAFEPNSGPKPTPEMIASVKAGAESAISTVELASAAVLFRSGEKQRAVELLRSAVQTQKRAYEASPLPSNALRYVSYVGVLSEFEVAPASGDSFLDQLASAVQIAEQLAKQDPRSAEKRRVTALLNYRIGQRYAHSDRREEARQAFAKSLALRRTSADLDPTNDRKQLDLFIASAGTGDEATAEPLYQRYSVFPKIDNEMRIDLARGCSRLAQTAAEREKWTVRALELLSAATEKGFDDVVMLESELDFDSLRDRAEFRSILDQVRR